MYNYGLTIQEIADFEAEMAELTALDSFPTEEDIEEMARWYGED